MALGTTLGDLVRQALHVTTGPPRLYTAALRAGAGPQGGVEVLRVSEAATRAAAAHATGVPGRTNAVRHFLWQAVLTARLGADLARAVAAAQESGSTRRRDSEVDEHNNAMGRAYGGAHAAQLSVGSARDAATGLVPVALAKWDSGELIWVRPHRP